MKMPDYYTYPHDRSFNDFLLQAKAILNEFRKDGYRISNSCRFSRFMSAFSNLIRDDRRLNNQKPDIALLAEGIRDFSELEVIAKSNKIREQNRLGLQIIFGGSDRPSDDSSTKSRDFQFELYLAALFDLSGFCIEVTEPDFCFKYAGSTYSVAAKRINSEKKIKSRFSEAKKQIEKSGIMGFIAVSLDRIVWNKIRKDPYVVTDNPDSLYKAGYAILNDLLRTKIKDAALENTGPMVIGLIPSLVIPAILPSSLSFGFTSTKLFLPSFNVPVTSETYKFIKDLPQKLKWPPDNITRHKACQ